MPQQVVIVRHGETDWAKAGRHTGRTDVPLNEDGRRQARGLGARLNDWRFAAVFTSPLSRAVETCELAGFGSVAAVVDDLREWDYGEYEGIPTAEIRARRPGWVPWDEGVPGGEALAAVSQRADQVIHRVHAASGDVVLFAHGHLLRILTARWLDLDAGAGRLFVLDPAGIGVLGYEREQPALLRWNATV